MSVEEAAATGRGVDAGTGGRYRFVGMRIPSDWYFVAIGVGLRCSATPRLWRREPACALTSLGWRDAMASHSRKRAVLGGRSTGSMPRRGARVG